MNRYLKMAVNQAMEHNYEDNIDYKHCAVIVKGGSILSVGFNKMNTNGFMEHFANQVKGLRKWCISMHAECHAICQAREKTDLTGSKIYVARIRPDQSPHGKIGMSRPCAICSHVLVKYGISKAYYTINDYEYGVMNVKQMKDQTIVFGSIDSMFV